MAKKSKTQAKMSEAAKKRAARKEEKMRIELEIADAQAKAEVAMQKIKRVTARRVRAATEGVNAHTLMSHENTRKCLEDLKKKGMISPAYEPSESIKMQLRVPIEYKEAVINEAERLGISQSELVRRALLKFLPREVAKDLPEVRIGRPAV